MSFAAALRWLKHGSVWTWRACAWSLTAAALLCAFFLLALRYWFLPNIETYREDIAQAVSRAVNLRITIGRISADWDGIRPHLKLEDVSVYDDAGRRALDLARVESTLAWRSLAVLRLHFHALDIYQPQLEIRRDTAGVFSVAGIRLKTEDRDRAGFTEWLLQQPDVEVHGAAVTWTDELRQAPPLKLSGVALQLVNRGNRHRFGLRAVPPAELASPVDLRGDVRGENLKVLSDWNGRLFLQLDSVDLAAWKAWVDIPIEVARGSGSVRSWLTFNEDMLSEIVADVKLSSVRTRLRSDLPELDLDELAGRIGWKQLRDGFEFSAKTLSFASGRAALGPSDVRVRLTTDRQGADQGEAGANALDLAALVMLADHLPLSDAFRAQLVAYAPRGHVNDLAMKWKGPWQELETYSVRGAFAGLAFRQRQRIPGISGLTGTIDATEKGGTLTLAAQDVALDAPEVFRTVLPFDTVAGQLVWTRTQERLQVRLDNLAFANADGAGTLSGTYNTVPQGKGEVDLTGALTRADARSVPRYIPHVVKIRPWLDRAIIAGHSNDVRFRMKGRLDDFPYVDDKRGLFQVLIKVSGGTLDYAERWPRIENLEGEIEFRGVRMDVMAREGTLNGVKLSKVRADIPHLKEKPEMLTVTGEADGATADFLAFIAKTPVTDMIDHFTEGMQAQGPGKLTLKIVMPLGQLESTKVAGSFQLIGNQVIVERDVPAFDQVNGRIEFTESSAKTSGLTGTFLGGPATLVGESQRDSTLRANLTGRASADNVRKAGGPAWMQYLKGSVDWRGTITLRKKVPHIVIESNLQGMASMLPAPFAKAAADTVALRIERRFMNAQSDRISFAYGDFVRAELVRRNDGKQMIVERGAVRFGGGDMDEPDRPGVWMRGAINRLDFDEWLAFGRGDDAEGGFAFAGADLKFGQLDVFGRRFSDLALTMTPQAGATQLTFAGREIEGMATWRGEGRGRLNARLKKLVLPTPDSKAATAPSTTAAATTARPPEFPALDVVVENFASGQKQLGRLELTAVPQERDWKIEKLRLANADGVLSADGLWQGWLTQPRTQMNVRLDVSDIGKTLTRWGYPAGVRRGTAKIEGQLSWAGNPQDFDYPTLSGKLAVEAANGQFVKLDPGIGKLLGIMSLQALPRRITLDFRDVFSEGFLFDSINGALQIERGIVHTENFRIQGPPARVVMAGDVDLARETQKLRVRVMPQVAESVAIAGALVGGPVTGAAVYLAQKLLRDSFEQIVSFDYNVTGSWSEPHVAKAERAPQPVAEGTP